MDQRTDLGKSSPKDASRTLTVVSGNGRNSNDTKLYQGAVSERVQALCVDPPGADSAKNPPAAGVIREIVATFGSRMQRINDLRYRNPPITDVELDGFSSEAAALLDLVVPRGRKLVLALRSVQRRSA